MRNMADRLSGCITFFIGCVSLWEAFQLYPYRTGFMQGDHVFPGMIGLGLMAAGLLLVLCPEEQPHSDEWDSPPAVMEEPPDFSVKDRFLSGKAMVPIVLLGYTILMPLAGFIISTFLAGLILFRSIGAYRWRICCLEAFCVTIGLQLVFVQWLQILMPAGWLLQSIL